MSKGKQWLWVFLSIFIGPGLAHSAESALILSQCISRALATFPAIQIAASQADYAQARNREATATLWPTVHTDVQYLQEPGYSEIVTNRGQSNAQLLADYLAYDGGRRRYRIEASQYNAVAARLGLAAARNQLVRDTTIAFYSLIQAGRARAELEGGQERLEHYLSVLRALRQSGRANANDVLRIEVQASDNRLSNLQASQRYGQASLLLASFIGAGDRADLRVEVPLESPPGSAGTVENNPALKALEQQAAAARRQVEAARAERLPTFSLALSAGFLGVDPPSTINRYGGASYGGLVSMPIFEGGAIAARIDQANARVMQLGAQVAQTRLEFKRALDDAWLRYRKAGSAVALLERSLPVAEDSFQLAWARFLGGGTITLLEVIDSYRQLLTLRLSLIDRQFAVHQAVAEVEELNGGVVQ